MADIVKYLEKILSSRYGEDVRGAIHDSIKEINDEVIDYGAEAGLKAAEAEKNAQAAKISAQAAADSRDNAQTSAELTAQNLVEVQRLTQEAKESTANAKNHAGLSKSYAVGTNGEIRENDVYDNAKSYCEQAKSVAESLGSPITPQGTVAFEDLPPLSEVGMNWMYNISNEFTTTDDFAEGAGNVMPAGTNVYKIASGKWDCFAGSPVTGIKGNKEQTYRKGNVNLTPENIGALAADGDSRDNTVTFTSADSANPTAWTDVPVLTTGEKHSSLFGRISTMFKNVRYLYRLLGTTDISGIGDGTATGAIKAVNADLANVSNITQLFTGTVTTGGTITLTESYKNFRYIIFSINSGAHLVYPVTPVQGNYIRTGFVSSTGTGLPCIVTINITNIASNTQLPVTNCYITNMAQGGTWYAVQNVNIVRVYGVNRLS